MIDYHQQISNTNQHSNLSEFGQKIQYQDEFCSDEYIYADQMRIPSQGKQQEQRYSTKLNGLNQNYSSSRKLIESQKSDIAWQNNGFIVIGTILFLAVMILAFFCSTQKSILISNFVNQEESDSILKLIDQQQPSKGEEFSSLKDTNENVLKSNLKIIQQSLDGIEWPVQEQPYHIYNEVNSQLVLDVATAGDGSRDLIMYEWKNSPNQKIHFKKVYDNYYHIYNAQTNEYMKKSQKIVEETGVYRVKFAQNQDKLWELVPATKYGKNAFYILSQERQALDLNTGYANNGAWIILYRWNKNDNQVWFLRKDQQHLPKQERSQYKYEQKVSQLLNYIGTHQTSINECITFQEIKKEMISKQMLIPYWMEVPVIPKVENSEYTQQITVQFMKSLNGNDKKINSTLQNNNKKQQKPPQVQAPHFIPGKLSLQCAKNHIIAYIWYGQKQMPQYYIQLLTKCKNNTKLLTQKDYFNYAHQWNELQPSYEIQIEGISIRQRVNLLKLLYLYFESGIYADFDTQIHEECFQNVMSDEVIFTNRMDENVDYRVVFAVSNIIVPEENFMMVRGKYNPQIKRMIQEQIMESNERGGRRWRECKYRQCLVLQCQRHYRDNTYKKGFD